MAKTEEPKAAASEAKDRPARSATLKTALVVATILTLEAAGIILAMRVIGGPAPVSADVPVETATPEEERLVEVQVLDGKLPNSRSGIAYLYDVEIYVQVKQRHEPQVTDELTRFRNEIRAEITAIWKAADPRQFQEPMLESLTRKIEALLRDRFGEEGETGEAIVQKAVIVCGTGFRIDG